MTNKTGPATQQGQPTTPRPMFTIAEREELWALVSDLATAAREVGAGRRDDEVSSDEYGDRLRVERQARDAALEWVLARMNRSGT